MVKGKFSRPPKKSKRGESSASGSDNRFVSDRAKELFEGIFDKKKPVPERGFKQDWPDHHMGEQLEQIWNARG